MKARGSVARVLAKSLAALCPPAGKGKANEGIKGYKVNKGLSVKGNKGKFTSAEIIGKGKNKGKGKDIENKGKKMRPTTRTACGSVAPVLRDAQPWPIPFLWGTMTARGSVARAMARTVAAPYPPAGKGKEDKGVKGNKGNKGKGEDTESTV